MADTAHLVRKAAAEASLVAVGAVETAAVVEAAAVSPTVVAVVEAVATTAAAAGNPRIFRFFFPQEGPVVN